MNQRKSQEFMQAVQFTGVGQPLQPTQLPVPELAPGWTLVRVHAAAICGSDIHILEGHTPVGYTPITLGHEISGVVVEVNGDSERIAVNDRVFVNPIVGCGECLYCERGETNFCPGRGLLGIAYEGGMAEYVAAPTANLTRLPDDIPFSEIAMIESAGTAFHALRVLEAIQGEAIVVIGAGGLGLQAVRIATALGLRVVSIDPDSAARSRALLAGAERALSPTEAEDLIASSTAVAFAEEFGSAHGFAHAVDCVGFDSTVNLALQLLRPRGSCSIIGIGSERVQLPSPARFVRSSLQVRGIYTYTEADIASVIKLVTERKLSLGESVSGVFPLSAANQAVESFISDEPRPVRVVIEVSQNLKEPNHDVSK